MLHNIHFTSKAALKQQALFIANGDAREAKELYGFLIDGMENLPDIDPIPPTWQDSTKDTVNGLMSWIKDNQEMIANGISYVRSMFSRTPPPSVAPSDPLPPIN